jgi:epoxyqueuosine reductase
MKALAVEFRSRFGGKRADFRILCNSPIPEKPLAEACGLGFLGRNGLIITPEAGSLVIIAAMTLPFFLEGDGPPEVQAKSGAGAGGRAFPLCAGCDQDAPPCAGACPTGAVRGDGTIALERCIQWYASGKGETVPANIAALWGERLYGCVECQNACVHNRRPIKGVETGEGPLPEYFNVKELLTLSEDELKKMFKGTAMGLSWLGPAAIRRNAEMVLRGIKG